MDTQAFKTIALTIGLVVLLLIVFWANTVFLIAFASILLAIFLNAVGRATQKITKLPYPIAILLALIVIVGILTLTFWLYSPLIAEQFHLLMKQLPQAMQTFRDMLTPYFGGDFLHKTLTISNEKFLTQLVSVFSTTIGSITSFIIFLIVGLYFALDPERYVNWIFFLIPAKRKKKVAEVVFKIGHSLHWWIMGKLLSMTVIGVLTYIGLSLLHVSLAFILAFLAALLTFIPYVGAILASIPAIFIGFAQSPWTALYVTLLYIIIHFVDGYFITPSIEQRTVSIPPAMTILAQVLLLVLIGASGLALATPLAVVAIALVKHSLALKMGEKT